MFYYCTKCGKAIHESHPREEFNGEIYCGDCAFIEGVINENELLSHHYFFLGVKGLRAVVHNGEVCIGTGKFPWEKSSEELRKSQEYKEWRRKVFERDGYTCAICGQVGGTLNAHHIKSYKNHKKERLNIDNGMTLCESCHKNIHKNKDPEWVKG